MLSVNGAIEHLGYYRMSLKGSEAVQWLWGVTESVGLYGLYLHYFPQEWANSEASFDNNECGYYTDRELEFLRLFERAAFFPMQGDVEEFVHYQESRMEYIPVWTSCDFDSSNCADDLSPGWQFLRQLLDKLPDRLDSDLLRRCEQLNSPLKHLHTAISCLEQATGNNWIDTFVEQPWEFLWLVDDIEYLRRIWAEAEEIRGRAELLIDWIEESGKNRKELVTLWNSLLGLSSPNS